MAAPETLLSPCLPEFLLGPGAGPPVAGLVGKGEVAALACFGGEAVGEGAHVVSGEVGEAGLVGLLADFHGGRRSLKSGQRIYFSRLVFIALIAIVSQKPTPLPTPPHAPLPPRYLGRARRLVEKSGGFGLFPGGTAADVQLMTHAGVAKAAA